MNERVVWINGHYVPESQAKISIYDSALMFGDMVFEMTRSFNKKQFKLREHLERLYYSIQAAHIPIDMSIDEMEKICQEVIDKNSPLFAEHDEHRLMINVSRGPLSLYAEVFNQELSTTIVIADFPLKWTIASMGDLLDNGINAVIPSQRAIPAQLLDPKIKSRSRMHFLMANTEVSKVKGKNNWALLLDPDGFITEGTGANFFIVRNGQLITPEPRNILRGISREYVMEIAKDAGIEVIEKNIEPYDVMTADEAFMTATPFCILPVMRFQGQNIGNGKMGVMTKQLLKTWSINVGIDIEKQIHEASREVEKIRATSPYQFKG